MNRYASLEAEFRGEGGITRISDDGPPPSDVKTPARASRFFSAAEWEGRRVPPRRWLVPGLVPDRNVTLLGGDGGTGKSLLALQLAFAIATGRPWIGRAVEAASALYLSAEDEAEELHRRSADILRAQGGTFEDAKRLTLRSVAGEDALLAVEDAVSLTQTSLMRELEAVAEEATPKLIVIDTLADVYPANENDRVKVRAFVGMLRGLALRQDCAVVLLGHPSLSGMSSGAGTSGSTAWSNSVRSRLYLERVTEDGFEADPDRRVLSTRKLNYGRVGGEIVMRWQRGAFVAEEMPSGLDALAAGAKAERVFLKLLGAYAVQGRRVNASGGSYYAPKVFAEHPEAEGVTKRAFRSAMEALLADGKIAVEHDGPPSRRVTYLAEMRK